MMCPTCELGTLKPVTWSAVFRGVKVEDLEGYNCSHCGSDPIYLAQIKRNEARIAAAHLASSGEPPMSDDSVGGKTFDAIVRERDALKAALIKIQQWDCLNPPRSELLADLPWLKRLVDETLTQAGGVTTK